MATDYGALKDIVAISGSLIGAASAISVAWIRRAKWMPPEETVGGATAKLAGLVCAVVVGALFVTRMDIGLLRMVVIAIAGLCLSLIALGVSIYTNTKYAFIRRTPAPGGSSTSEVRMLGGSSLTREASRISAERHLEPQQLFENANYNADLVWTPSSRAMVQVRSTMGFIALQAFGSIALASMAIAFSLSKPLT